jgi:hypothetical protein
MLLGSVNVALVGLVMREVGNAAVLVVILYLYKCVPTALSFVFMSHYFTSICFCYC